MNGGEALPATLIRGDGGDEIERVRARWRAEHLFCRPFFNDLTRVHDRDAISGLGNNAEVVRDQHQRRPTFASRASEQI